MQQSSPPTLAPEGLRARKKRETRAALVTAAQELVLAHGLGTLTVEAICARADVSRRTFFNYFETKDEAVLGMRADEDPVPVAAREVFVAGGPTGAFPADLVALVRAMLDEKQVTREEAARRREIVHREPALIAHQLASFGRVERAVTAVVEERARTCAVPLDPALGAIAAISLVHAAFTLWHRTEGDDDVADHLDAASAQLALALTPSPTR